MKKIFILCLVLIFGFTLSGFAVDNMKYKLDNEVINLTLNDLEGNKFDLEEVLAQKTVNGVIFVFLSHQCPGSIIYDERYVEYTTNFRKKGIRFIGISSNSDDTVEAQKAYAEKKGYNFPILKDWENVIADRFDAEVTPHAFFIDKEGLLLYKGAIDDNRNVELVKNRVLAAVVDEHLRDKNISIKETSPFG